jgi:hypothetical protein
MKAHAGEMEAYVGEMKAYGFWCWIPVDIVALRTLLLYFGLVGSLALLERYV